MVETTYTGIPEGMLQHRYNVSSGVYIYDSSDGQAAYWTATKRKPVA
jgi:hypothetical protein